VLENVGDIQIVQTDASASENVDDASKLEDTSLDENGLPIIPKGKKIILF